MSEKEWIKHYNEVFTALIESKEVPKDVILLELDNINEILFDKHLSNKC